MSGNNIINQVEVFVHNKNQGRLTITMCFTTCFNGYTNMLSSASFVGPFQMIIPNIVKAFGSQSMAAAFQGYNYFISLKISRINKKVLNQESEPCINNNSPNTSACIAEWIQAWLPDGYSLIFTLSVFGPSSLRDYGSAMLHCKI